MQICLFVESTTKWYVFKNPGVESTVTFFLLLRNNHFEPVSGIRAEKCPQKRSSSVLMPDNLKSPYGVLSVNTAEAYESDQRRNFSSKQQDLIFNGEVLKSFTVLENENFKVIFPSKLIETCDRCCRNSTKAYPLTIDKVEYEKIINKKYAKRCNRSENNLCQLCSKYVTQIKSTWNFAWPSVTYSILVQSSNENLQKLF